MTGINALFLLLGLLLFISVVASTLSARLGLPLLLLFLGVGMLAGEDGIGQIAFDDFFMANLIGQLALATILLDGGLRTRRQSFRVALKPAAVLASWGVIASVALLGVFATLLLGIDWRLGLLMAAIVGSTDAAAVFSLLRNSGVRLNERVQATLEIESGANDPMAILLVSALIGLSLQPEQASVMHFVWMLISQLGLGALLGLGGGWVLSRLLSRLNLAEGMYALLIFSGGILVFSATNLIDGSGFLAIYLAGIVVGNRRSHATEHVFRVMDGLAWLAQASMFMVLGLLVTPSRLLDHAWEAVLIAVFLTLVARPLAVASSLKWFKYQRNEIAYISWVGLRGAVPITLAMMPIMMGVPGARLLFDVAFAVVILSLLFQGATIALVARFLGVEMPPKHEPHDMREIWVGERAALNLLEYPVAAGSVAEGQHPDQLAANMWADARCVTLVRHGQVHPINPQTRLQAQDSVWLTVPEAQADQVAELFDNIDQDMGLQAEFFGEFMVHPDSIARDLAAAYGLALAGYESEWTVRELLLQRLARPPVSGDRVAIGDFSLVVRAVSEQGQIEQIGLKCPSASPSV